MLFSKCESCSNIGTRACGCGSPPHLFCETHALSHILSMEKHSMEPALESLTSSEVSSMEEACNKYRLSSIRQAVYERNSQIEYHLQQIRKVEEECSSTLETILNGPVTRDFQQILSYKALPLFSDSCVARSLLNLKHAFDFSSPKILSLLNTLNSSLLSSLSSSISTMASSSGTSPLSPTSVQASLQISSSQKSSTQTDSPTKDRWELLKQTKAHNSWITSIAVSECEKYIASASGGTINVHELQTLQPLRTLKGHASFVYSVAFLGNEVVSGSADKTIKIWEEDRCVKTLNLHSHYVHSVCVSSSKKLIVSGSSDKTAVVFRLEDNHTLHTLSHEHWVESVAFSRDDREIVSGSTGGNIYIWKTETGELLKTLNAHSSGVKCVNYSGKFIASSSHDKTVKIWDTNRILKSWFWNRYQPSLTFSDHTECVSSVDIRDDLVASLGMDDQIIVRDAKSGKVLQTLQAHGNYPGIDGNMGLKILEEGKFIVSAGGHGEMKVWRRVN